MFKFRPNVAALILNSENDLLICERINQSGAWQFPQGGADEGEALLNSLFREISEEIGLTKDDYHILKSKGGYRYLYPEDIREKKIRKHGFHGQEQTYYLCKLKNDASPINVDQDPAEFQNYRWIRPEEFQISWLPQFKRETYRKVMQDFFEVTL